MKLSRQLHIAFAILLLFVIGITSVLFYSLLLDKLVDEQRKEMRDKGRATLQLLGEQEGKLTRLDRRDLQAINNIALRGQKMEVILFRGSDKILFTTLPVETAQSWVQLAKEQRREGKELWQGKDDKYIVELVGNRTIGRERLLLAMPLQGVRDVRASLIWQVVWMLAAGGLVAYLLSVILTRRLVKPLSRLQQQLHKVKQRRFSEVERVKTGGEVGEVAESLYQMAAELERFQRTQKEFFQNASHELKTPLMSIQGYAEGIRDHVFIGEQAEQGLEVIINESKRLKGIVTEMILLAKLESEEDIFQHQPVPVKTILEETVTRLNPLRVQKGLQIDIAFASNVAPDVTIRADHEKLLQALINIISNAIRYARRVIAINVELSVNNEVIIHVKDDGNGIQEALLPQLFHRFVKGKDGETGLGMAISRVIIERCGGTIAARNHPDGGALITLRFPRK
ncbi:MAG: sensor histidine kinase [Clostridia bacterium]